MFNQNFYVFFRLAMKDDYEAKSSNLRITDKSGISRNIADNSSHEVNLFGTSTRNPIKALRAMCVSHSNSTISYGLHFGSGGTQPTKDDYTLESFVQTQVRPPADVEVFYNSDKSEYRVPICVTNILETQITLKEIGLFCQGWFYSGSYQKLYYMVDRTLLETPITLAPGESAMVDYRWKFVG